MKFSRFLAASAAGIALFAGVPAFAQEATPAPQAAEVEEEPATGVPALWKVADEDTTIYMFGTVHLLPADVDWYSGAIKQALDSADELVTEVDLTPETKQQMAVQMQTAGMLPEGQTLRGLMTEEQRASYEAGLAKIGMPAAGLDIFEPWLASLVILQITLQAGGFEEKNGVESVLESLVREDVVRTGLESAEFQIAVFDEMPIEQQVLYLLEGVEDPLAAIAGLAGLVDVWAKGQPDTLGSLMNEAFVDHPNLGERLLYSRNANWAEWIDERLDEPGVVFMAVGAGHLGGEKSVQDYLDQRGISTTRIQ